MNPLLALALPVAIVIATLFLGDFIGNRIRNLKRSKMTLLLAVNKARHEIEPRWVKVRDNKIVWGVGKVKNLKYDMVVRPSEGSKFGAIGKLFKSPKSPETKFDPQDTAYSLASWGRDAFIIDRDTLQTLRLSSDGNQLESVPEDPTQIALYALGQHERAIANPTGGTWLDALAAYTPLLVIVVGVIVVIGFALIKFKGGA